MDQPCFENTPSQMLNGIAESGKTCCRRLVDRALFTSHGGIIACFLFEFSCFHTRWETPPSSTLDRLCLLNIFKLSVENPIPESRSDTESVLEIGKVVL